MQDKLNSKKEGGVRERGREERRENGGEEERIDLLRDII